MDKNITIIDKDYSQWVKELVVRYRQSQEQALAINMCLEAIKDDLTGK